MLLRLYVAYWEPKYLGIVISLQHECPRNLGSNPRQKKEVFAAPNLQIVSVAHSACFYMRSVSFLPEMKQSGHETDAAPSVALRMRGSFASTPPCSFNIYHIKMTGTEYFTITVLLYYSCYYLRSIPPMLFAAVIIFKNLVLTQLHQSAL